MPLQNRAQHGWGGMLALPLGMLAGQVPLIQVALARVELLKVYPTTQQSDYTIAYTHYLEKYLQ